MAIPAFAGTEGDITTYHSFSAFQIFKGDVEGNDIKDFKISNVTWGSNIADNPAAFLDQLKADSTLGTQFQFIDATDANTAQKVLEVISKWDDSDANSIAFARVVCHYLYRMPMQPRNPPLKVVVVAITSILTRQVIIWSLILPHLILAISIMPTIPSC